uniref:HMG box domain-containing protein n=1 Tax=Glossina austeni TaxID=7395 RepID=A0A1A9VL66_GLOAU
MHSHGPSLALLIFFVKEVFLTYFRPSLPKIVTSYNGSMDCLNLSRHSRSLRTNTSSWASNSYFYEGKVDTKCGRQPLLIFNLGKATNKIPEQINSQEKKSRPPDSSISISQPGLWAENNEWIRLECDIKYRQTLKLKSKKLRQPDICRSAAKRWRTMSDCERQPYIIWARKKREMARWASKPKTEDSKGGNWLSDTCGTILVRVQNKCCLESSCWGKEYISANSVMRRKSHKLYKAVSLQLSQCMPSGSLALNLLVYDHKSAPAPTLPKA